MRSVVAAVADGPPMDDDLAVLVGVGSPDEPGADAFDVVTRDPGPIRVAVDAHPIATTALALLLRTTAKLDVDGGLVVESATYSALQAGPEHRAWLAARRPQPRGSRRRGDPDPVQLAREGTRLRITLARPHVRNAFDASVREGLLDGLAVAAADDAITRVIVDGAGPNFCSGGDLEEFGTLSDPASAHVLRLDRSPARAMHRLRDRITVVVHGACIGAGVELAAFAGRVVARPDATFSLPEVGMGLVPGAGGTVGIPRRIGRHRTAWLALTGNVIDAPTALDWGLVDTISEKEGASSA